MPPTTTPSSHRHQQFQRQRPRQQETQAQHPQHPHHSQLRLKCILLGSAGAGKTSLLRRFIHGTFEGHPGNDGLSGSNRAQNIRRGRSTTSTLGADYYVKKVDNPLFGCNDQSSTDNGSSDICDEKKQSSSDDVNAESHVMVQLWDTAGKERLKPQRHPSQYDKKSNFYQFLSIRPSSYTDNSSNYEHRYNNWGFLNGITEQENNDANHNIIHKKPKEKGHGHNTPQKHGRPVSYHRHNSSNLKRHSNEPMGDALFRNVDACMLVYDATSSMSFLHLMQWHSEWVRKLKHWEKEEAENNRQTDTGKGLKNTRRKVNRRKRIPFIVVANKVDLFERENVQSQNIIQSSTGPKRRSVMGFRGGEYKGHDMKYEFEAENTKVSQNQNGNSQNQTKGRIHHNSAKSSTKRAESNYPPTKKLTYSLKNTSWSTDAAYLNALQLTEDQLPANRTMILLWCQRNGIPHVEASAFDGRGVEEAMEHLVRFGVEELGVQEREEVERKSDWGEKDVERRKEVMLQEEVFNEQGNVHDVSFADSSARLGTSTKDVDTNNELEHNGTSANINTNSENDFTHESIDPSQYYFLYQPRQEEKLDLFARYSPKDEQRCSPFKCWLSFHDACLRPG